jgi:hypothetical protein
MYDLTYGPASGATNGLNAAGSTSAGSAANTILSGIVNSNATSLATGAAPGLFSENLLASLQGFHLGG